MSHLPTEKGTFNHFIGILGRPGSGKSVEATRLALELMRETPCFVVAHDNGWRLPDRLPDGTPTRIERHESTEEAVEALAQRGNVIHAVASENAEEVISLAERVADRSLRQHGYTKGYPCVVLIDEVVAAGVCDPNRLSPSMRRLIALRRHKNVGVIWTCQSARLVHNQLLTLATELRIFSLTDGRDLKRLDQAGVSSEQVASIAHLPKYQFEKVELG